MPCAIRVKRDNIHTDARALWVTGRMPICQHRAPSIKFRAWTNSLPKTVTGFFSASTPCL